MTPFLFLRQALEARLGSTGGKWFKGASAEIADGVSSTRFGALLSLASRAARRAPVDWSEKDLELAGRTLPGWNPERWNLLEVVRVALVLSYPDLGQEAGAVAVEEAFAFADEGELCALYRSLALLPDPKRFVWRAGEGCRSNMRSVFEATALDTPFPRAHFDDGAWNQAVIKCLFIGAPLWRLWGLDERLSPELARMALDLADERRSAGRPVQHELWLCLGAEAGERGRASLEQELDPSNSNTLGRQAAVYGLARAGATDALAAREDGEKDKLVLAAIADARAGNTASPVFRKLDTST